MVVIMCVLYFAAHFLMKRTALGRHIYAVGGNAEAARLCGVPVGQVRVLVFALCGLLAGFGGVLRTSLLMSGSPTYGFQIELMVIASVVVGGTSIFGGTGRIFGTPDRGVHHRRDTEWDESPRDRPDSIRTLFWAQ